MSCFAVKLSVSESASESGTNKPHVVTSFAAVAEELQKHDMLLNLLKLFFLLQFNTVLKLTWFVSYYCEK